MNKPKLQSVLESELDEAKVRVQQATEELARVESAYKAYMGATPTDGEMRQMQPMAVQAPAKFRQEGLQAKIAAAVNGMGVDDVINAKNVFNLLGRDEEQYESTRPTIAIFLSTKEKEGHLKKVGHGVYQKPEESAGK